jgi:hypothetical protein
MAKQIESGEAKALRGTDLAKGLCATDRVSSGKIARHKQASRVSRSCGTAPARGGR